MGTKSSAKRRTGKPRSLPREDLRPDVVLLDIQLPDMNGFDICRLLDGWNGAKPDLILVSSRELADYGDQVETSCARGFLLKDELSAEAVAALLA